MGGAGRILLADDDAAVQAMVRRAAERNGYEVVAALSGCDVLPLAAKVRPDLIVLDIAFPDADGRDLLAKLKRDPATAQIPILVWSGRDYESDRRIALDLGAEDYLEKTEIPALIPKIGRILLRLRPGVSRA